MTVLLNLAQASTYPKHFLWGVAISAHQTEGKEGGGETSDWYAFEHPQKATSPIANGDTADLAVDHWNRFDEDFGLGQKLGLNTIRTSLAWEKIEPLQGEFSSSALRHYRDVLQSMRAHGLRPMIALHHSVNPQWFINQGGWLSANSPRLFLEYATRVVDSLGDLCDLWISFNEPMVYVSQSYLKGQTPPQLSSPNEMYEAAFQIARAHRMVVAMIHEKQGVPTNHNVNGTPAELRGVGLANAISLYDPENPRNNKDVAAARFIADLNNWDFIHAASGSRLTFKSFPGSSRFVGFDREFPKDDLPLSSLGQPTLDWIGINYYMRWLIRYNAASSDLTEWVTPPGEASENGWSIYPAGLEMVIRQTAADFPMVPLIVTENGLSDSADLKRPAFIQSHLKFLDQVVIGAKGYVPLDVRGYYHWSLMDNFEWLSGYKYQFGLVEIKRDTLTRVPRPSFETYRQEILLRNP